MKRILYLSVMLICGINNVLSASEPKKASRITGESAVQKYYTRSLESRPGGIKGTARGAVHGAGVGGVVLAGLIGRANYVGATGPDLTDKRDRAVLAAFIAIPAVAGAIAAVVKDAFRSTSVAWIDQLKKLFDNKDAVADQVLYLGVPPVKQADTEFVNKNGKLYLLSKDFNDTTNAFSDDHYELYLMPKDAKLIDTFLTLNELLKKDDYKNSTAFLAVRPTPGVTKLPGRWLYRNIPRIIVGFKGNQDKETIKKLITKINSELITSDPLIAQGLNVQPRYSQKINNLMYVAYGSGDYKDTPEGKKTYVPQVKSLYYRLFGPTDEQMAYSSKDQEYYPIK